MLENIFTLLMLILLQAVLGFDNLLYISLESKKAVQSDQQKVRKTGILIAIGLRIVLLFVLVSVAAIKRHKGQGYANYNCYCYRIRHMIPPN